MERKCRSRFPIKIAAARLDAGSVYAERRLGPGECTSAICATAPLRRTHTLSQYRGTAFSVSSVLGSRLHASESFLQMFLRFCGDSPMSKSNPNWLYTVRPNTDRHGFLLRCQACITLARTAEPLLVFRCSKPSPAVHPHVPYRAYPFFTSPAFPTWNEMQNSSRAEKE